MTKIKLKPIHWILIIIVALFLAQRGGFLGAMYIDVPSTTVNTFSYSSFHPGNPPNLWPNEYIEDEIPADMYFGYSFAVPEWTQARTDYFTPKGVEWCGVVGSWGISDSLMLDLRTDGVAQTAATNIVSTYSANGEGFIDCIVLSDDFIWAEFNNDVVAIESVYTSETGNTWDLTNSDTKIEFMNWYLNETAIGLNNLAIKIKQINPDIKIGLGASGWRVWFDRGWTFNVKSDVANYAAPLWLDWNLFDFIIPYHYSEVTKEDLQNLDYIKMYSAYLRTTIPDDDIFIAMASFAPNLDINFGITCTTDAECNQYADNNNLNACKRTQNALWTGPNDRCKCSTGAAFEPVPSGQCYHQGDVAEPGTSPSLMAQDAEVIYQQGYKWLGWYRTNFWYSDYAGDLNEQYDGLARIDRSNNEVLFILSNYWQMGHFPREPDYADKTDETRQGAFFNGFISRCSNFDVIQDTDIINGKITTSDLNKYSLIYIKHSDESALDHLKYLDKVRASTAIVIEETGGQLTDDNLNCIPDAIEGPCTPVCDWGSATECQETIPDGCNGNCTRVTEGNRCNTDTGTCTSGVCVPDVCTPTNSTYYQGCIGDDIYWFDDCDGRQALVESCQLECRTGSAYCYITECIDGIDNDADGCSDLGDGDCTDGWDDLESGSDCGGTCTVTNTTASYDCYDNDVHWYDNCGNRTTMKEDCEFDCKDGICTEKKCAIWEKEVDGVCEVDYVRVGIAVIAFILLIVLLKGK